VSYGLVVAAAARFDRGATFFTHRAFFGLVGNDIKLQNRKVLCLESDLPVAPVNNIADSCEPGIGLFHQIHDLKNRSTRGNDVFDDEHPLAGMDFKPAPELHFSINSFRKNRADAKHPADFRAHDNTANGRRYHKLYVGVLEVLGDFAAQKVQVFGVLQNLCTLKILCTMESGRELKMPFKEGLCLAKDVENLFFWEFHGACVIIVDGFSIDWSAEKDSKKSPDVQREEGWDQGSSE
jgi:hypothetical protein